MDYCICTARKLNHGPSLSVFAKLQTFIRSNLPSNIHDRAMLLWASVRTPGLLDAEERAAYAHSILALQKEDGGWALPSFGGWPRHDGAPNEPDGDSDGYATSLATLVLCQEGYSIKDAPIRRAVTWIRQHQRVSGRWYTRSLYSDRFQNYLSNMGTAYAVMALNGCRTTGQSVHAGLQRERNELQTASSSPPFDWAAASIAR